VAFDSGVEDPGVAPSRSISQDVDSFAERPEAGSSVSQGLAPNRGVFVPGVSPNSCRRFDVLQGGADTLLSVREVAARLGLSTATVYKLCDRGELAHVRISNAIRVTPEDLQDFIGARRTAGESV
jgi:excisionase family DNA binding protein